MSAARWLPLESNPDAINEFLSRMDVPGVECVDVFSFDEEMLTFVPSPQIALLLCYPDYKKVAALKAPEYEKLKSEGKGEAPPNVFFMRQRIQNACGTFALFHSLANNEKNVDLGSGSFREWLNRAKTLGIEERSKLLEEDKSLSTAHEATARAGETEANENTQHHFITFVVIDGQLYEIDSGAPCPRALGPSTPATLAKDAGKHILELMAKMDGNISFSALALVHK